MAELDKYLAILVAYILGREAFFYYQTHKLINKLMSRNYWEYERAKNPEPENVKPNQVNDEPLEEPEFIV